MIKEDVDMLLAKLLYLENENKLLNLKIKDIQKLDLMKNQMSGDLNLDSLNNSNASFYLSDSDEKIIV